MNEIQHAIFLHKRLAEIRDWSLGPKWRFSETHKSEGIKIAQDILNISEYTSPNADREVRVPSVWHAALLCSSLQHLAVEQGTAHFLFRGQGNKDWPLTASIYREGVDSELESQKAGIFSSLLSALSFNTMMFFSPPPVKAQLYFRMGSDAHLATAQHYGIKTNLVDFTTDADVAAWFASGCTDSNAEESVIEIIALSDDILGRSHIILPPPFVERLYLQRGVFMKTDNAGTLNDLESLRIVFPNPNKTHFKDFSPNGFDVLRENGTPVDIYPAETLFEPVKQMTDDIISGHIKVTTPQELNEVAKDLKPHFSFVLENLLGVWAQYIEHFEDMLYQLAYSFPDTEDIIQINQSPIIRLVADNPEVIGSISAMYEYNFQMYPEHFPPEKQDFARTIIAFMNDILAEIGYSHDEEKKQYFSYLFGENMPKT